MKFFWELLRLRSSRLRLRRTQPLRGLYWRRLEPLSPPFPPTRTGFSMMFCLFDVQSVSFSVSSSSQDFGCHQTNRYSLRPLLRSRLLREMNRFSALKRSSFSFSILFSPTTQTTLFSSRNSATQILPSALTSLSILSRLSFSHTLQSPR